jgi:hypothetical protein
MESLDLERSKFSRPPTYICFQLIRGCLKSFGRIEFATTQRRGAASRRVQSPPPWTNAKLRFFQPAEAGFACVAANSIRLGTFQTSSYTKSG